MAHGDGQPSFVGQLLQPPFPQAWPMTIIATSIHLNQEMMGVGIGGSPQLLTPTPDGCNGKSGCHRTDADIDESPVVGRVVNAIRRGLVFRLTGKIIDFDLIGVLAVACPPVFEVADQFCFFRIDTDSGLAMTDKQGTGSLDQAILVIPMGMDFAHQPFDVGFE